ncbi:hypothetical protein Tco_1351965 [Tanacetum coccineum]
MCRHWDEPTRQNVRNVSVERLINEDKGRQDVILDLAFQFEDSCAVRDLICTLLKESSEKDSKLHLSMYGKAAQLQKQLDAKSAWFQEKYSGRTHGGIGCSSSQTDFALTEKELHQLRMDEEALKEMLEEEAMNKKAQKEKIRQEQAENDAFLLEFGVVRCLLMVDEKDFRTDKMSNSGRKKLVLVGITVSRLNSATGILHSEIRSSLFFGVCMKSAHTSTSGPSSLACHISGLSLMSRVRWPQGPLYISAGALGLFISWECSRPVAGVKVNPSSGRGGVLRTLLAATVMAAAAKPMVSTMAAAHHSYNQRGLVTSVKPASSLNKRFYMLIFRERMELDLEARLMGETLVLNRTLDPFFEGYIELNDLYEPFELRRNQGNDLMPTIEEGEVIEEFRTRDDELDAGFDDYPSYCDYDKKIHIDCAHNIKFSCMIGFEFTHANFFPLLYVNVMSKKFHNSIMKDKMVYKGNNFVGALMNVPIFVGTFFVVMDFAVLENMNAYRDEGIGDVILGEPFLREIGIKTKWFERIITIYNGDDEVTYQMVRSHLRFKRYTNEQYNKIPPLLKVSKKDEMNGISHAYQKLKGFYKGVLNLGPDYIRDEKTEEWLIRGHISVHEME